MAGSRTTPTSSASSSGAWPWVRRVGLFGVAYSLTALVLVAAWVLDAITRPEFGLAAAAGLALFVWVWRPSLRAVAAGILLGALTYVAFMYWMFEQLRRAV
ncbi:MAG TPA: hypothetical protein VM840_04370 [Actinomycetota bacterium]|nr:hypothetical protein [Actinomycetota bacterium]